MSGRLTRRSIALVGLVLLALTLCLSYGLYGLIVFEANQAEAQADCKEVLSLGPETKNQITSPFEITGNSFRISGEAKSTADQDIGGPLLTISPYDEEATTGRLQLPGIVV